MSTLQCPHTNTSASGQHRPTNRASPLLSLLTEPRKRAYKSHHSALLSCPDLNGRPCSSYPQWMGKRKQSALPDFSGLAARLGPGSYITRMLEPCSVSKSQERGRKLHSLVAEACRTVHLECFFHLRHTQASQNGHHIHISVCPL